MKKIVFAATLALATVTASQAQRIKGSDTCLPLSQQEAESFLRIHPSASVTVTGGGSGVGISALIEGTTDIAQLSRRIKFDERRRLQAQGKTVKEVTIAYDALAVVVHPSNPVTRLTREQLESIFTGRITNWKDVGGPDLRIVPYSRETSSGTYEFFRESVLQNRNYMNGILSMPATGAIVQSIGQTRGGIGYIGLAYLNPSVKSIRVSYDQGATFVAPSVASAKNETYPIVRGLYYYYTTNSEAAVKPFIDYVLSPAGQRIVSETGFITLE
jgi:phosphate transport system substrate-binding protein